MHKKVVCDYQWFARILSWKGVCLQVPQPKCIQMPQSAENLWVNLNHCLLWWTFNGLFLDPNFGDLD